FGESRNILSIRSTSLYPEHSLGDAQLCLDHKGLTRAESFARILHALNGSTVKRILCVPYHEDELVTALVLKELFAAPLCTFVMDDNNIFSRGISDELMREVLAKSDLRLAISPEMRNEYERKHGFKFWVVPPVVRDEVLQTTPRLPAGPNFETRTGVLVGSLWSRKWLQQLRQTIRQSGLRLHWYGNARAPWLKLVEGELSQDGITDCGFLPEEELTAKIKEYPFAVIPSGTLDAEDDRQEITRLSLPTRLPYLLAASNTPLLVLGSPQSAAAQFLKRFQVGRVSPYEGARLRAVVEEVCQPEQQLEMRHRAARHSSLFSAKGLDTWIWRSLEQREPVDDRFEAAFKRTDGDIVAYLEPPAPKDLLGDNILVHQALRRLKRQGFAPDFVVDIGSSSGIWSDMAKRVFPQARFVLVDPLHSQYLKKSDWFFRKNPDFECVPVAVSDKPGEAELQVSSDLYGSSLLSPDDFRTYESLKVPVLTLDQIVHQRRLAGRGLLKIDVQFAEHLVLAGAKEFLPQVDALIVELSMIRYTDEAKLFPEMCDLIRRLGFRYYEDLGGWRSPVDGTMLQKDVLFVRENLFAYKLHKDGNGPRESERLGRLTAPATGLLSEKPEELTPAATAFCGKSAAGV
ncbi:MAG TPA: FkbM family methyltransferase, partial [Clostridia bacterium]|nr:FkbM family methyltransferase [Clostridia bacterium]